MVRIVILLILIVLLMTSGIRADAEVGYSGPGSRLEALPTPGQLQPIPRPPRLNQPRVPAPPPMPYLNRGAINPRTGQFFPPQGQGIMNPKTGEYYPPIDGHGYFNPRTGEYYPRLK